MPLQVTRRVGRPRFGPVNKLRHRLYEPLTLLWMFNPAQSPIKALVPLGQHSTEANTQLSDFYNALSWFCDCKPAGATVSSVAAEYRAEGNNFWLASSHEPSLAHLKTILHFLESVPPAMTKGQYDQAVTKLFRKVVAFGKLRVKRYCKDIRDALNQIIDPKRATSQDDAGVPLDCTSSTLRSSDSLIETIREISTFAQGPIHPCETATSFEKQSRYRKDFNELNELVHGTSTKQPEWSKIRQSVARLATWHSKIRRAVLFAQRYPQVLQSHTCEWLALPPAMKMPESDAQTNLRAAIGRMFSKDEHDKAVEVFDLITSLRDYDLEAAFIKQYNNDLNLQVHAEVYLMEHFYLNKLNFVENHRYIGCSKPSCFCCSLYMRYHPGNFVVRESHGNAWVTWSPPLLSRVEEPGIRRHNLMIMNEVIRTLRRVLLIEVEGRFARRLRSPDSTSGSFGQTVSETAFTG